MKAITLDVETTDLLHEGTVDYNASPYKLKPHFKVHCITVQEINTGKFICFYDGPTYIFDGRPHVEEIEGNVYNLEDYAAIEYEHKQLNEISKYLCDVDLIIAHNGITFDLLVLLLYFGIDFSRTIW